MRFQAEPRGESGVGLNLPAMVDMVFTLLAFFVLATQFLMPERDFGLGYRQAAGAVGAVREDFPAVIPVRLRRAEAGVAITVGQARLPDDAFDALRAKLAEINMPGIGVLVMADPGLSVDQVARALDAVLASPMRQVAVARLREAGPAAGPAAGPTAGAAAP